MNKQKIIKLLKNPRVQKALIWIAPMVLSFIGNLISKKKTKKRR